MISEATRLLGPLVLIFVGLYAWKKQNWARLCRNLLLALAFALIAAAIADFELVVRTGFPDRVLDAAGWLLLAIAFWLIVKAEIEKKWGDGGT